MEGLLWGISPAALVTALFAASACWRLMGQLYSMGVSMQRVLDDFEASIKAIGDSLADLDAMVQDVDETVEAIRRSPVVQSLLAEPAKEGEGQDG